MRYQPIYDIAELCAQKGVTNAVLCPGSRCAPLTLAFSKHPDIHTKTFSDERSAAFIAMGIAEQTNTPSILLCTSGSAAYNFAPAVAEAFFQEVPLIIFTADRPKEWIDQLDGQTIRQQNIFGQHVKKTYDLPADYDHSDAVWYINRIVNEAINLSQEYPKGPVHINAPFREPLYPAKDQSITFSDTVRVIKSATYQVSLSKEEKEQLKTSLTNNTKILIVAGQQHYHETIARNIGKFARQFHIPVIGDIISNLHSLDNTVRYADNFLGACSESVKQSLQPELLITFGKSVISKNMKLFLRKYKPKEHWHLQEANTPADTYQSLTNVLKMSPGTFFEEFSSVSIASDFNTQKKENYLRLWEAEEHRTQRSLHTVFETPEFNELSLIRHVITNLPSRCNLHIANSMSIRYANAIGIAAGKKGIHVYSNRGTSGIDGCTSTAVGHSLGSEVPNFLITGDMAFLYDRNAFWHNYPIPNLHVLVINNHGGIIFSMIDGPGNVEELQEFFVTTQRLSAKHLANEFGFDYLQPDSLRKFKHELKDFMTFEGKTKVLEIETSQTVNQQAFDKFKSIIKKGYDA